MPDTLAVTTNNDQELYVIPTGHGYTCLGFDVCRQRSARLAQWLQAHDCDDIPPEAARGTLEAYARYQTLLDAASRICFSRGIRCDIDLTTQLVGLEGKRVEVVDRYGQKRRFYVGKSTGWLPIHLEIARRNSTGGCGVTGAPFQSVRVLY